MAAEKQAWEYRTALEEIEHWKERALTAESRAATLARKLDRREKRVKAEDPRSKLQRQLLSSACNRCGRNFKNCFCGKGLLE